MQIGLSSGSTIVVRPMSDGEDVDTATVRQELDNLRLDGRPVPSNLDDEVASLYTQSSMH